MKLAKIATTGLIALASLVSAQAAVIITSSGLPVISNFDSWGGNLPADFTLTGPSAATTYRGTSASLTTGGTYNVSGFDFQASSTAASLSLTGTWENDTGATITSLTLSYDAYVVTDRASRIPSWAVSSTSGFDLSALTWASTDGTKTLTTTITGLSIAPGDTFDLTWATDRGTGAGSTPKIGLDNISVTAVAVPEPGTIAMLAFGGVMVLVVIRRKRSAHS